MELRLNLTTDRTIPGLQDLYVINVTPFRLLKMSEQIQRKPASLDSVAVTNSSQNRVDIEEEKAEINPASDYAEFSNLRRFRVNSLSYPNLRMLQDSPQNKYESSNNTPFVRPPAPIQTLEFLSWKITVDSLVRVFIIA